MASLDEIEFPDADTSEKIASPPQSPFAVRRTSSHPEENETEGYFLESTVDSFGNGSPEGEAENGGLEVIPDDHQDTETDGNESAASVVSLIFCMLSGLSRVVGERSTRSQCLLNVPVS